MTFEEFRDALHSALTHLYDPDYVMPDVLRQALGCGPGDSTAIVQTRLIQYIRDRFPAHAPKASKRVRNARILRYRFIERLTQEQTAERFHVSLRSIQRVQREAVHVLATQLWHTQPTTERGEAEDGDAAWRSQVREEMLALLKSEPEAQSELMSELEGVLRVVGASGRMRLPVRVPADASPCRVQVHPAVLRQILISLMTELGTRRSFTESSEPAGDRIDQAPAEEQEGPPPGSRRARVPALVLDVVRSRSTAQIKLTAPPLPYPAPSMDTTLLETLLEAGGGSMRVARDEDRITVIATLPVPETRHDHYTVLVVEDNEDLATLYDSYCIGSPYELRHIREGKKALERAKDLQPDLIVLDVMLPDVDGWDLLLDLHTDPKTRDIPVAVCSVITDERLALDLGARIYLRKPVWREQLIGAFDAILRPAGASEQREP